MAGLFASVDHMLDAVIIEVIVIVVLIGYLFIGSSSRFPESVGQRRYVGYDSSWCRSGVRIKG